MLEVSVEDVSLVLVGEGGGGLCFIPGGFNTGNFFAVLLEFLLVNVF